MVNKVDKKATKIKGDTADIIVKILSLKEGLIEYTDVDLIRIVSKDYNLMIMKDYLPIIGEIKGNIEIIRKKQSIKLEDITAYYIHKHNEFNLFIKET